MKFEKTSKTRDLWDWFVNHNEALGRVAADAVTLQGLDDRIRGLDPRLSWEIGPGLSKPWQLVISPNLNQDVREKAQAIVSSAPVLPAWEFHFSRQPKTWDYQLELHSADPSAVIRLDARGWTFVLLRYPDGAHEVLLKADDLPELNDDLRWQAAAITLESILGEEMVMDRIREFELVDTLEPRFADRERPIDQLRDAISS